VTAALRLTSLRHFRATAPVLPELVEPVAVVVLVPLVACGKNTRLWWLRPGSSIYLSSCCVFVAWKNCSIKLVEPALVFFDLFVEVHNVL
jgi:hypothetical protein